MDRYHPLILLPAIFIGLFFIGGIITAIVGNATTAVVIIGFGVGISYLLLSGAWYKEGLNIIFLLVVVFLGWMFLGVGLVVINPYSSLLTFLFTPIIVWFGYKWLEVDDGIRFTFGTNHHGEYPKIHQNGTTGIQQIATNHVQE